MPYTALALDLDGTLLNETGELTDSVRSAVSCAMEGRIQPFLLSGRMHTAIEPFWDALNLRTPITSYNGARIQTPGMNPIHSTALDPALAGDVLDFCSEHNYHCNAYFEDRLYVFQDNPYAHWYAEYFGVPLYFLSADEPWPDEAPTKLLVIVEEEILPTAYASLQDRFADRTSLTTSSKCFVEVLPVETSKGHALKTLASFSGIPLEQWVAVGDGMNDKEMLETAGLGVAVENGVDELKTAADLVIPPLYEQGLVRLLHETFGLDSC